MGAGIFVLVVLILLVIACVLDVRNNRREERKFEEKKAKWLHEQINAPKYRVYFSSEGESAILKTAASEHEIQGCQEWSAYGWTYFITSEDAAKELLKFFYKKGYFIDENAVTYPVCNVQKAWVDKA